VIALSMMPPNADLSRPPLEKAAQKLHHRRFSREMTLGESGNIKNVRFLVRRVLAVADIQRPRCTRVRRSKFVERGMWDW